jgi:hypothetical protein
VHPCLGNDPSEPPKLESPVKIERKSVNVIERGVEEDIGVVWLFCLFPVIKQQRQRSRVSRGTFSAGTPVRRRPIGLNFVPPFPKHAVVPFHALITHTHNR